MPRGIKKDPTAVKPEKIEKVASATEELRQLKAELKLAQEKLAEQNGLNKRLFEKCREYEDQIERMQVSYEKKISHMYNVMTTAQKTIDLVVKGAL